MPTKVQDIEDAPETEQEATPAAVAVSKGPDPAATVSFGIDVASLRAALAIASRAVPNRSPKPVLKNVLMEIDPGGGSSLSATDLELGVRVLLSGVRAGSPVRLLLRPDKLKSILEDARADTVEFFVTTAESEDGKASITCGKARFSLAVEAAETYPVIPRFTGHDGLEIAPADFKTLVKRTIFATDQESTRYALGGCMMAFRGDRLTFVATDGRRLAHASAPANVVGKAVEIPEGKVILPTKFLRLIDALPQDDEHLITLQLTDNAIHVLTYNAELYSRLVEGRFPRYQDVLDCAAPHVQTSKAEIKAGELGWAVEKGRIATSEETRSVDFRFTPTGMLPPSLAIAGSASDVGEADVAVDLDSYQGEAMEVTLDPGYVLQGLHSMNPEDLVTIGMVDPKTAVSFRTGSDYTYVIMPLTRDR